MERADRRVPACGHDASVPVVGEADPVLRLRCVGSWPTTPDDRIGKRQTEGKCKRGSVSLNVGVWMVAQGTVKGSR